MTEHDPRDDYIDAGPSVKAQLKGPGLALWLCGWIIACVGMLGLVITSAGFIRYFCFVPREPREEAGAFCAAITWTGIVVVWGMLILRGASQMWDVRRYRPAVIGAILAILPLPCAVAGFVTLPVGVWSLVVLLRPEVRARFGRVGRGSMAGTPPADRGDAHPPRHT